MFSTLIGKKEPLSVMDTISKWKDIPNESSDIQLVGVNDVGDGDSEKQCEVKKGAAGEKTKEGNKDDDITLGIPEVVVEPTTSKTENIRESEGRSDGDKTDEKEKNKELTGEDTIVKAEDELATNTGESTALVSPHIYQRLCLCT